VLPCRHRRRSKLPFRSDFRGGRRFPRSASGHHAENYCAHPQFFVLRGSRVHQGQLLAILENKDWPRRPSRARRVRAGRSRLCHYRWCGLPEQIQKPNWTLLRQRKPLTRNRKLYDSRKELFQQGALPRRDLDSAQVALAQARSQYKQAQKQLDDLKNLGEKQALKSAGGQLSAATGKYQAPRRN